MTDKWSLEETPSKAQKVLTIVLAVAGGLACGSFTLIIFLMAIESGSLVEYLPAVIFFFALFLVLVYVLYRVLFGKPEQISRRGRLVIGFLAVALSVLILVALLVNPLPIEKRLFAFVISAIGLMRGVDLINRNRHRTARKRP